MNTIERVKELAIERNLTLCGLALLCNVSHSTSLIWEDGMHYEIDKVTDIRQAAAMKAGGQGDRYTIWVNGKPTYLFFERSTSIAGNVIGRWFVERRIS